MPRPYSEDLRQRVIADVERGNSRRAAADKFGVSASFAIKLKQLWDKVGSVAPKRLGGAKQHALEPHTALVERMVSERPDATLDEYRAYLADAGVRVGRSSIDRFLKAKGLSFKKKPARQRAGASRRR